MLTLPSAPLARPDTTAAARLFTVAEDPAPPSSHFLAVPGVRTLLTPGMLAAHEALAAARAQRRFVCVLGDAGVGKTFAVRTTAHRSGAAVLLDPRANPAPADLRAALHDQLRLPGPPPADLSTAAEPPRTVIVDDADRISPSCFEYLRFLHDDTPGGLCVVLIAQRRGVRHLRAQRMLTTRTTGWLKISPLTRDQIPQAIPALHPLWQTIAPDHLQDLDTRFAQGSLRRWVLLTHHTQRALAATETDEPNQRLLQTLVDRIDTPPRRRGRP